MAKIDIQSAHDTEARAGYAGPASLSGDAESAHLLSDRLGVWLVAGRLADGARLTWPVAHGEEAVFVRSGALLVNGTAECEPGGAVILERDASVDVVAQGSTEVVHFGSRDARPGTSPAAQAAPGAVHVVGPGGRFRHETGLGSRVTWFADSTDADCDVTFFMVDRPPSPADRGTPHTHSQDEVIFVLGGEVSLGAQHCREGTAIGIPAEVRYALSKSAEGFTFLNYRPGRSVQTLYEPGADPRVVPESGMERGGVFVGDVRTLTSVPGRSA